MPDMERARASRDHCETLVVASADNHRGTYHQDDKNLQGWARTTGRGPAGGHSGANKEV